MMPAKSAEQGLGRHQLGTLENEPVEVVGETLAEPQFVRDVGLLVVERLDPLGAQPLHVPGMEELVRHRAEDAPALRRVPERAAPGDDRAVAVLHAVTVHPGQVVGQERVGAGIELRQLAEDLHRFADGLLDVADVGVGVAVRSVMVQRHPNRLRSVHAIVDGDAAEREVAELGRAVHQVVDVGRGEDQRVAGREELGGDAPLPSRRLHERHARRPRELPAHEHHRRRHVHVRVRGVDAQVGAVGSIAEHLVGDHHRAVVSGHVPLVQVRPLGLQLASGAVGDAHLEHVLGELVQRVAAG